MAKVRKYRIKLYPGSLLKPSVSGFSGYSTGFALTGPRPPTKEVEADSLDKLLALMAEFAAESGVPVYEMRDEGDQLAWIAYVDILDGGRKPNGFDKAFSGMKRVFVAEPAVA